MYKPHCGTIGSRGSRVQGNGCDCSTVMIRIPTVVRHMIIWPSQKRPPTEPPPISRGVFSTSSPIQPVTGTFLYLDSNLRIPPLPNFKKQQPQEHQQEHPPLSITMTYLQMIQTAIQEEGGRKGCSLPMLKKAVEAASEKTFQPHLLRQALKGGTFSFV